MNSPDDRIEELSAALRAALQREQEMAKDRQELRIRREQMRAFPFCSDHRDKVLRRECYACRLEAAERELSTLRARTEQE